MGLFLIANKLFSDKRIRFVFVGGINTLVGYGSYVILVFFGVHYIIANTLATVIGITTSYFSNKYFTFKVLKKSSAEIIRFVLVYAVGYFINLGILYVLVDVMGGNRYISGLITLLVTTMLSYFGHNYFSFKK